MSEAISKFGFGGDWGSVTLAGVYYEYEVIDGKTYYEGENGGLFKRDRNGRFYVQHNGVGMGYFDSEEKAAMECAAQLSAKED